MKVLVQATTAKMENLASATPLESEALTARFRFATGLPREAHGRRPRLRHRTLLAILEPDHREGAGLACHAGESSEHPQTSLPVQLDISHCGGQITGSMRATVPQGR
jgi:hypothetical protein